MADSASAVTLFGLTPDIWQDPGAFADAGEALEIRIDFGEGAI